MQISLLLALAIMVRVIGTLIVIYAVLLSKESKDIMLGFLMILMGHAMDLKANMLIQREEFVELREDINACNNSWPEREDNS